MVKIGATDCGEPAFNLSWVDKLKEVNGAVIISKSLYDSPEFFKALLDHRGKIIFHCTVTGLGGTNVEPNVPHYTNTLLRLENLVNEGFPSSHVVVRIDPIIGSKLFGQLETKGGIGFPKNYNYLGVYKNLIEKIILIAHEKIGINRFRYSFLDLYPHVRKRFEDKGFTVPKFALEFDEITEWIELFRNIENEYQDIKFESCAEKFAPKHHQVGCVSRRDFNILGIDPIECQGKCYQRKTCLCSGNKVELLNDRKPCQNQCLYCFWK